jgi:putative DNA primase/helicase
VAKRPVTHSGPLNNLPAALSPLMQQPRWCAWRWEQQNGQWKKPPLQARFPQCYADTNNLRELATYKDALAAVAAGHADGITYVVGADDGRAAIDVDNCRDPDTGTVEPWARNLMNRATDIGAYCEVTPSGSGIRVWVPVTPMQNRCTKRSISITAPTRGLSCTSGG